MFGNNSNNNGSAPSTADAEPTLNTKIANQLPTDSTPFAEKGKKGSSGSKTSAFIASAKNSITNLGNNNEQKEKEKETKTTAPKDDLPTVVVGPNNNSAGDSKPGPKSTFRVGVTEDKNKKCRRTMEDTHSFLYNFLPTLPPATPTSSTTNTSGVASTHSTEETVESDNGYFAIFDGHAGTYAADWCGKKLHLVLEDTIRKHPNTPIPELLDMTFTNCDGQLEKLPVRNSGCTAVCAVLRWEDRPVPNSAGQLDAAKGKGAVNDENSKPSLNLATERQRVLYTANVGDARIVLCRNGKALRLSYDHKGSDENEGKRVANAGGLILNNRVNGVLAVTRALGDSYMKELVTGHPYTTETVLQPEADEFIILACDGLWDVCSDQEAVDLVHAVKDPQEASKMLVDYALGRFSSDNLSCMIVRLDPTGKFPGLKTLDSVVEVKGEVAQPTKK
ncbi:PP2C-domain-containing protein [Morchella conica CCBAS932]|uniref:PP2C-domain-containing protein n=1 Tax=Morchella conica CCBAS932 TaxID=1392247 RepID=A0A3N4KZ58_9PEZI|nr:PP2C-domain-containing protein [Morchella conica CCBAS932]